MKTALVTGANRGIGLAIVRGLLAKDFRVALSARSMRSAETAVRETAASDGQLLPVELDVTRDPDIAKAVARIENEFGGLDVLINNAGIFPDQNRNLLDITREQLHETFDTNTFGPVAVTRAFLPLLRKSAAARVIHVSSSYGQMGGLFAGAPSYCLSKLALNGVTRMHHELLREQGIAVFAICPGWVHTDMGGKDAPLSPEEGADTAIWLATSAPTRLSGRFIKNRKPANW